MGRKLLFDIESNGLMKAVPPTPTRPEGIQKNTMVHCLGAVDIDTGEELYWGPAVPYGQTEATPLLANPTGTLEDGYKALADAELVLGHNIIGYDLLALEHLVPGWKRPARFWDTLVIAKIVFPVDMIRPKDFELAKRLQLEPRQVAQFVGRHSLKAWGIRTGTHKRDYEGGFKVWTPEMAGYMMDDVRSNLALWRLLEKRMGFVEPEKCEIVWPEYILDYENKAAAICERQEEEGVSFDVVKGRALEAELKSEKARIEAALIETFGSWWAPGTPHTCSRDVAYTRDDFKDITVKRYGVSGKELKPYVGPPKEYHFEGATSIPVVRTTFSPSSRDHLGQRLQDVFGWKPRAFGNNGKPTVDESTLEEIPEAVMPKETRQLLLDFFVVNKTLGMLSQGARAWLRLVDENGRIHGRCDPQATVTGRAAHSNPNLGQCPGVKKEKIKQADGTTIEVVMKGLRGRYGWECRELFTTDPGWDQTGVDASALELIDLGHYLVPFDGGKFRDRVCDADRDPHTEHAQLTDLTRGDTKTATYLYIYGGSAYKLSLDLSLGEGDDLVTLLKYRGLSALLNGLRKRFDDTFVDSMDDVQKAKLAKARQIIVKFESGIEGIKAIKAAVTEAAKKGYLRGMDGRRMFIRKPHAALNTLLQSAGAQTCKLWMVLLHERLAAEGLEWGRDFRQVLWVHDELQFTHRPGLGPTIIRLAQECLREAGITLGLRGEYRGAGFTGQDWAETH